MILKIITLAACTIGFIFLAPKALAEFRGAGNHKNRSDRKKHDIDAGSTKNDRAA